MCEGSARQIFVTLWQMSWHPTLVSTAFVISLIFSKIVPFKWISLVNWKVVLVLYDVVDVVV